MHIKISTSFGKFAHKILKFPLAEELFMEQNNYARMMPNWLFFPSNSTIFINNLNISVGKIVFASVFAFFAFYQKNKKMFEPQKLSWGSRSATFWFSIFLWIKNICYQIATLCAKIILKIYFLLIWKAFLLCRYECFRGWSKLLSNSLIPSFICSNFQL